MSPERTWSTPSPRVERGAPSRLPGARGRAAAGARGGGGRPIPRRRGPDRGGETAENREKHRTRWATPTRASRSAPDACGVVRLLRANRSLPGAGRAGQGVRPGVTRRIAEGCPESGTFRSVPQPGSLRFVGCCREPQGAGDRRSGRSSLPPGDGGLGGIFQLRGRCRLLSWGVRYRLRVLRPPGCRRGTGCPTTRSGRMALGISLCSLACRVWDRGVGPQCRSH